MKSRSLLALCSRPSTFSFALAIAALLAIAPNASATNYYWDTNGATAGSTDTPPTADGTWGGTLNWSTSADGDVATTDPTFVVGDFALFSAGADATGTSAVTLNGDKTLTRVTLGEGIINFSGDKFNFAASGTINGGGSAVFDSVIDGAATNLVKTGTGASTITLNADNTFATRLTIAAGNVIANRVGGSIADTVFVRMTGNTAELNVAQDETIGSLEMLVNSTVSGAATLTVATTITVTNGGGALSNNSAALDGSPTSFTKNNPGTHVLSGTSSFTTSALTINGGILSVGSIGSVADSMSNLGAGSNVVNLAATGPTTGTLLYTGSGETTDRVFNLGDSSGGITHGGTGPLDITSDLTSSATAASTLVLGIDGASLATFSGLIADGAFPTALTKVGGGTGNWNLTGANTFTGPTTITLGNLAVSSINSVSGGSASSSLGAPTTIADGTITIGTNGGLIYNGSGETTDRVIGLTGNGAHILTQAGTGPLIFTSDFTSLAIQNRGLTLTGSSAPGTGEISGAIGDADATRRTAINKEGTGTWTLSGANTFGNTVNIKAGTLSVSSLNSLTGIDIDGNGTPASPTSNLGAPDNVTRATITMGANANATLSYTGSGESTNRAIALTNNKTNTIAQDGTGTLEFTSDLVSSSINNRTLVLSGSSAGDGVISGALVNSDATRKLSVTKNGTGTWTLSGANTHTGGTTVNDGVLAVDGGSISDTALLRINAPGVVDLTGTETVDTLFIDGVQQDAGIWAPTGSAEPNDFESPLLTGSGTLVVLTGPSGYQSWADTNVGGEAPSDDFDNDGTQNGVEYFMNAPAGFTPNPGIVADAITWTNGENIAPDQYGTQYVVQTSADLVIWDDVDELDLTTNDATTLTYDVPTGAGKLFVRLSVTPN